MGDDLRPERGGVLGEEPAAEGARDDELVGGGEAADEVEDVAGGAQARERGGGGVAGEGNRIDEQITVMRVYQAGKILRSRIAGHFAGCFSLRIHEMHRLRGWRLMPEIVT